jgi:hypothetical protein
MGVVDHVAERGRTVALDVSVRLKAWFNDAADGFITSLVLEDEDDFMTGGTWLGRRITADDVQTGSRDNAEGSSKNKPVSHATQTWN